MATAAKKSVGKTKQSPAKPAAKAGKAVSVKPVARKAAPAEAAPVQSKATIMASAQTKPVAKAAAMPATPPKTASHAAPAKVSKTNVPAMKAVPSKPSKKPVAGIPANDAELLAMPEEDYMNEAQQAYFKNKLLQMREEILENARETGEHLKENEVFADPNDRATVEEENMLEQRVRDRERKLLKKINASLLRIEEGVYGYCLETGEPIGLPRLLARPTAELSIEAQEKHERLEKLYAD